MGSLREIAEIRPIIDLNKPPGNGVFAAEVLASRLFQTARRRVKLRQIARSLILAEFIVGASLLANGGCQSKLMCLTHRIREQARSHRKLIDSA
jgi:hypothetical protein